MLTDETRPLLQRDPGDEDDSPAPDPAPANSVGDNGVDVPWQS